VAEMIKTVKELPSSGGLKRIGHCLMERRRRLKRKWWFAKCIRGMAGLQKKKTKHNKEVGSTSFPLFPSC